MGNIKYFWVSKHLDNFFVWYLVKKEIVIFLSKINHPVPLSDWIIIALSDLQNQNMYKSVPTHLDWIKLVTMLSQSWR